MKIFQLIDNPYVGNPYIRTLMDGISDIDKEFQWGYGVKQFWSNDVFEYNIIHIHWPQVIINFFSANNITDKYERRLMNLKARGIKIVATCHNLEPHYEKDTRKNDVYRITYNHADCIIHLGEYSLNLLKEKYLSAKHCILPHHIYDKILHPVGKSEALNKLGLSASKKYILCFGDFRDNEERNLIDTVLKYFYEQGIEILAPHYYKYSNRRNKIMMIVSWLKCKLKILTTNGLHIYGKYIDNELLPYFYGAADICLIQRKKILNSGNLSMGFYMGKVVVGPNVGNVGQILNHTNNPTFNTENDDSVLSALNLAFAHHCNSLGEQNHKYALNYWSTEKIAKKLNTIYKSLV